MGSAEQYIIDDCGKKIAIIIPIDEYEQIKEDLHDLVVVAERRDEKTISLDQLKKRL